MFGCGHAWEGVFEVFRGDGCEKMWGRRPDFVWWREVSESVESREEREEKEEKRREEKKEKRRKRGLKGWKEKMEWEWRLRFR